MATKMALITSVLVPALTAVLTVMLTVWLYQKRDKLNALRAIKSEAEQNRETAKSIHRHLTGEMVLRQQGKERPHSLTPFSTNAFQNVKNTGVLAGLPGNIRERTSEHYSLLDFTNHQLRYRQQIRGTSRALSGFSDLMNSLDQVIQLKLHALGAAALNRSPIEGNVKDAENDGEDTVTFDEMIEAVDDELDKHPVLGRII